ncbi:MAG: glycosyltransferase family 1 protein [Pseudomonadota bacterium]
MAFTLIDGANWTGGYNYLVNLLRSVDSHESARLRPVLFHGDGIADSVLAPFQKMKGVEVVRTAVFNIDRAAARLKQAMLWGVDTQAIKIFQEQRIDVIFEPATFYGWRCPIPALAWLADFQHRRLRNQFGVKAYWRRDLGFRAQVASGRIIMLSSEDARADCEVFYPDSVGRTVVVPFAVPAQNSDQLSTDVIRHKYGLPENFLFLPNQFWQHKNHLTIIEALKVLQTTSSNIVVAASGNPVDQRHPALFESLKKRVAALGLEDQFRFLGMIPYSDLVALMRGCTALVNPSLFEGWSTTVEEAKSLGVPLVLSDLNVHREQAGDGAIYFKRDSPESAAQALAEALSRYGNVDQNRREREAKIAANTRLADFAGKFFQAALLTVNSKKVKIPVS